VSVCVCGGGRSYVECRSDTVGGTELNCVSVCVCVCMGGWEKC